MILIGLARCIAMVLVWNDLAEGTRNMRGGPGGVQLALPGAVLFGLRVRVHDVLPPLVRTGRRLVQYHDFARSRRASLIYLGHTVRGGLLDADVLVRVKGKDWYRTGFVPKIGPLT